MKCFTLFIASSGSGYNWTRWHNPTDRRAPLIPRPTRPTAAGRPEGGRGAINREPQAGRSSRGAPDGRRPFGVPAVGRGRGAQPLKPLAGAGEAVETRTHAVPRQIVVEGQHGGADVDPHHVAADPAPVQVDVAEAVPAAHAQPGIVLGLVEVVQDGCGAVAH